MSCCLVVAWRRPECLPITDWLCCVTVMQQPGQSALSNPKHSSNLPRGLSCSEHTKSLRSVIGAQWRPSSHIQFNCLCFHSRGYKTTTAIHVHAVLGKACMKRFCTLSLGDAKLLGKACMKDNSVYLSTTRVSMQYHPWYIIFDIQRILLEQKLISHGYF